MAFLFSIEHDGIYHKLSFSNHGISKGLFQETKNPKIGTSHQASFWKLMILLAEFSMETSIGLLNRPTSRDL